MRVQVLLPAYKPTKIGDVMLSIDILGDRVELSGDISSLPDTINLDILEEDLDKIVIFDPVPNRGTQIVNAIIYNERIKNGRVD